MGGILYEGYNINWKKFNQNWLSKRKSFKIEGKVSYYQSLQNIKIENRPNLWDF